MKAPLLLEVCIDSVESALVAQRGGAHRLELCSDLLEGGVTPSIGLIERIRAQNTIPLHVMIRPRPGDFCYSADEFAVMVRDIQTAKDLGADGVVFGILDLDGGIDVERTRELVQTAQSLSTTFHRAFDMCSDLDRALDDILQAGINRLLTSGGHQRVEEGLATVARLVDRAGHRLGVMAGGGIRENNVKRIISETGVREIHANLGCTVPSAMRFRNDRVSLGVVPGLEYQRTVVSEENVRALLRAASPTEPPKDRPPLT